MPVTYRLAPEVESIAVDLIGKYHSHLEDVDVRYIFRSEAASRGGLVLWGDAKKVQGLTAFLIHSGEGVEALDHEDVDEVTSEPMFCLVVAEDIWRGAEPSIRQALVDHLLRRCRIEQSENGPRFVLVAPEAQEFADVLGRHGMWRDSLRKLVAAA
jgi:hypothetical protein